MPEFDNYLTLEPQIVLPIEATDAESLVNASTFNTGMIRLTGPDNFDEVPAIVSGSKTPATNATTITGNFAVTDTFPAGTYTVQSVDNSLSNVDGARVQAGTIGTFEVNTPSDISPLMTGPNAPTPFVVTESSGFETRKGWSCFTGTNIVSPNTNPTDNIWTTLDGQDPPTLEAHLNCWVAIDFGVEVKVSEVRLKSAFDVGFIFDRYPETVRIEYGNGDTPIWQSAGTASGLTNWVKNQTRVITLPTVRKARHWRVFVVNNNGHARFTDIAEIEYWGTTL